MAQRRNIFRAVLLFFPVPPLLFALIRSKTSRFFAQLKETYLPTFCDADIIAASDLPIGQTGRSGVWTTVS